jgi:hypothetical protein
MFSAVEQHVRERIAATPVVEDPFPHQIVTGVFPQDYYRELLAMLPSDATYRSIGETGTLSNAEAYRERYVCGLIELAAEEMAEERTFWRELAGWLLNDRFRDFLVGCYARQAAARIGEGSAMRATVDARLVRDRTNFAIGPHTDSPRKFLSLLFYLPRSTEQAHLGTSIFAPLDPDFRCSGGPHYPFDRFRRTATAPYVPNTLFVFFRTDQSFHGVEPIRDENVERNLLLYNIYVTGVVKPKASWFRLPWQSAQPR